MEILKESMKVRGGKYSHEKAESIIGCCYFVEAKEEYSLDREKKLCPKTRTRWIRAWINPAGFYVEAED